MARLTISLLGPPRIEVDGEPIAVDTRKAIALLAYLAVTGERKSRETLAALLWPEHDSEHARAALRRTLSALSKALGGDFLDVERAAVALDPSDTWLDVTEFRGHLTGSRDADAVALYRGDFLAGFGLRDSVDFEDWQFFEAETLKRELAGALERLAGERCAEGQFDGAIELARRWLALDPLQEPAHRLLMELYARSGQRSAALRQYRDCVRVLDGELGVSPLEETTALYEAIRENALPVAPPLREQIAVPPAATAGYPLVGRSGERRLLADALVASSATDVSSWWRARPASERRGSSTSSLNAPPSAAPRSPARAVARQSRRSPTPSSRTCCATRLRVPADPDGFPRSRATRSARLLASFRSWPGSRHRATARVRARGSSKALLRRLERRPSSS